MSMLRKLSALYRHRPQQDRTDDLGAADAQIDRQVAVFVHGRQQHRLGALDHAQGHFAVTQQG